eukprot:CAMPEP_0117446964 /NCGR_PEP_ID=MMETSP0759-20121206/6623_1 /TAXON_ID=63605 /ORGANISM="Percolomonas cosmopolitus, Strain WS" /LENGTH=759 /DNA_ID=CAMNT_0005239269 /DNA_START=238 /DNA_END=2517 /DNA_ORIENTATION=-
MLVAQLTHPPKVSELRCQEDLRTDCTQGSPSLEVTQVGMIQQTYHSNSPLSSCDNGKWQQVCSTGATSSSFSFNQCCVSESGCGSTGTSRTHCACPQDLTKTYESLVAFLRTKDQLNSLTLQVNRGIIHRLQLPNMLDANLCHTEKQRIISCLILFEMLGGDFNNLNSENLKQFAHLQQAESSECTVVDTPIEEEANEFSYASLHNKTHAKQCQKGSARDSSVSKGNGCFSDEIAFCDFPTSLREQNPPVLDNTGSDWRWHWRQHSQASPAENCSALREHPKWGVAYWESARNTSSEHNCSKRCTASAPGTYLDGQVSRHVWPVQETVQQNTNTIFNDSQQNEDYCMASDQSSSDDEEDSDEMTFEDDESDGDSVMEDDDNCSHDFSDDDSLIHQQHSLYDLELQELSSDDTSPNSVSGSHFPCQHDHEQTRHHDYLKNMHSVLTSVVIPPLKQGSQPHNGAQTRSLCSPPSSSTHKYSRSITEHISRIWVTSELLRDHKLALEELNNLIDHQGMRNHFLFFLRGRLFHNYLNKMDEALTDYCTCLELMKQHDWIPFSLAYANRGLIYFKQKRRMEALADFSLAIALDPFNSRCYFKRALVHSQVVHSRLHALSDLTTAISLREDSSYYLHRGQLHCALNMRDLALADFQRALHLCPSDPRPFTSLSSFYFAENPELSLQYLNMALDRDPTDATTFLYRASVHYALRDHTNSFNDLNRCKKLILEEQFQIYPLTHLQTVDIQLAFMHKIFRNTCCRGNM